MINNRRIYIDNIVEGFIAKISPLLEDSIKEIYLFGSRSRDDWRPGSDYDILIILERKDRKLIRRLYDAVIDILLETSRLVSLKIFTVSEFNRLRSIPTPFMQNIMKEGIRLEINR